MSSSAPAPARSPAGGAVRRTPGPALTVAIVATAAVAYSAMQTMVLPAIPALGRELHAGPESIVWVVSAFFISSAVSIPVVGRLGDAYGRVRMLIVAMSVFAVGTLAASLAPGLETLVVARLMQGVGAAVFPLSYALIDELLPRSRRTAGMGAISAAFGVGSAVGYIAGGPLLHLFGWRGMFVAGMVPALAAVGSLLLLPRRRGSGTVQMDWVGAGALAVALVLLLLAISQGDRWGWTSPAMLGLVAGVGACLAVVGASSRRHPSPMVDLPVYFGRPMLSINVSALLVGYAFFAIFVLVPGWITADPVRDGFGFGTSDEHVGLYFLPYAVAMVLGGSLAGRAGRDRQVTVLRVGAVTVVAGLLLLALVASEPWVVWVGIAIIGGGCSACLTALAQLVLAVAREQDRSVATGLNTMGRMVGLATAAQVSGTVIAASADAVGPTERGYLLGFLIAAGAGALSLVATVGIRSGRRASAAVSPRTDGGLVVRPTRCRSGPP